jgi:hypothetical protein
MGACAITASWRLLTAAPADLLPVNFYIAVFHDGTFPNKSQLNPRQTLHRPAQTITEKLVNGRPEINTTAFEAVTLIPFRMT